MSGEETTGLRLDEVAAKLADIVGASHLSSAPADVDAYGGLAPFAVVWPGSPSEVAGVLRACTDLGVAVGVAGGGTGVAHHWPLGAERPRVVLDTRRMCNILDVDETSLTVTSQSGILVRHLEEALRRQGLSLGPYPAELQVATLGGLLAAPPPSAHSPQTGAFSDGCLGLAVAHADGSTVQTRVAPRRATGPDIARLYVGSRGGLGVITTATMRVYRVPELVIPAAFAFASLEAALAGARELCASGLRPARLRVLGTEQAALELGEAGASVPAACVAVLAGPAALVNVQRRMLDAQLSRAGGMELPQPVAGRFWERCQTATLPERAPAGARVRHSRQGEAIAAVREATRRRPVNLWLDEFDLHGANLWLSAQREGKRSLTTLLLDAGLEPLRPAFSSLLEELRAKLDPRGTLVVMES
jgi:alkyldihydroxyacetonephosphate synthase